MDDTFPLIMNNQVEIRRGEGCLRESVFLASDIPGLGRKALEKMNAILSTCEISDNPDVLPALVNDFYAAVRNEESDSVWNNLGFEIGNFALRILSAIERTENFQLHFCKLISSICVVCMRNAGAWRQVVRPLVNVFANKKLDYVHLKQSIKEFKNILKCADGGELSKFTKQNLHILQGFSMLAFHVGDFLFQMDLLEIVLIYTSRNRSLAKAVMAVGNQSTRQLIENLDFSDFQKDSRLFLNELNLSFGKQKRIFSINCNLIYFGNLALSSPRGTDGIWMDISRDSQQITIFCNNFLQDSDSEQCAILQLPTREIEKLTLECGSLFGGDCYCITIEISSLPEMYKFTSGHSVVCIAPRAKNSQEVIHDFVRVIEELVPEIRLRSEPDQFSTRQKTANVRVDGKPRTSCTSPTIFMTGVTDSSGHKCEKKWRQSQTSPLTLQTCPEIVKTRQVKERGGHHKEGKISLPEPDPSYQVQKFCGFRELRGGKNTFSKNKPTKQKLEKFRLAKEAISKEEKNGDTGMLRDNATRIRKDWERSSEDFIPTQEFDLVVYNKVNIVEKGDNTIGEGKEENGCSGNCSVLNTSLLDPNGYAFKRWLRPTTSSRSNFWLNKIKDLKVHRTKSEVNVFEFTEDELSDDSKIFRTEARVGTKKRTEKRTKSACPAGRKYRKKDKENLKNNFYTKGAEERSNITQRGSKSEEKSNLGRKGKEPKSKVREKSEFSTIVDVRPPVDTQLDSHQSDKAAEKSSGEGKQIQKKGRSSIMGKRILDFVDSRPQAQNSKKKITALEDISNIAKKISSGFREWVEEVNDWEIGQTRKHSTQVIARLNRLAEDEEDEMENRCNKFSILTQYFAEACSVVESVGNAEAEMKNIAESMQEMRNRKKRIEELTGFAGRLKETICDGLRASFKKNMKQLRVRHLESLLFCNQENRFCRSDIL